MVIPSQPCEQCGALNAVTARFCSYCGQSVSPATPPALDLPSKPLPPTPTETLGLVHAVVAIEWLNWKALIPAQQAECQTIAQQKGLVFGATLDRQTGAYQFLRITHAPDAETCADTAVQLALALCRAVSQHGLTCRIGLDMEPADARDSLCAIAQRVCAPVNQVVASARLLHHLHASHYPQQPADHGMILTDALPGQSAEAPLNDRLPSEPADGLTAYSQSDVTPDEAADWTGGNPVEDTDDLPSHPDTTTSAAVAALPPDPEPAELADTALPAEYAAADRVEDMSPVSVLDLDALEHQAVPHYWMPATQAPQLGTVDQASQQLTALIDNHLHVAQHGQLVVLTGHEGAGKTRLVQTVLQHVLQQHAADQVPCFWLHGQSGPPFSPLGLWQNVISRFYQMSPLGQPLDQLNAVIADQGLQPDEFNAQWQHLMGLWFGWIPLQTLDASFAVQPKLLAHMLMAFFQLVAQHKPVVLLLDDLEEADAASVDVLLDMLTLGLCHELPVLVIVTHNQDAAPTGPLADALKHGIGLHLPLYQGDALTQYLQEGPLQAVWGQFPPHLLAQLTELSQGNPLIIEECLRLLFLKGALHPLTGPSLSLTVADPIMVFTERFALLPESAQALAQWFAVIGQPVDAAFVGLLTGVSQTDADITTLKEHGILVEDACNGVMFRHRLLQQWVYQSLPETTRQAWHNQLANTLDGLTDDKRCVPYAFLAEQAELANELELAAHAWSAAGVWAAQLHSLCGFNLAMIRAAQLFQVVENPGVDASQALVTQYLAQLNAHDQPHVTSAVMPEVVETAPDAEKLHQLLTKVTSLDAAGQFVDGLAVIQQTLAALAGTPESEQEQLYLYAQQAKWQVALGQLAHADDTLKQHVMPHLSEASHHPLHALSWLDAYTSKLQVQLWHGRPELFDTLDLMMSHPYLAQPSVSWQLLMSRIFRHQGHYARAQEALNQLQPADPADVQAWHIEQALLQNSLGQFEKALGTCQMAFSQPLTSQWQRLQLLVAQGHALLGVKKWDVASQVIKQAIAMAMDGQYRLQLLDGKLLWCEALIKTQQWDNAAQQLNAMWQQPQLPAWYQYRIAGLLASTLTFQGKPIDAGRLLEPLWKTVTDTRQLPLVATLAEQVGMYYLAMAKQSETPKGHAQTAIQFLQRAQRLWQQMQNPHQADRLGKLLTV